MTIRTNPLPKDTPPLKRINIAAFENLRDAVTSIEQDHWELEDGDIGIRRGDYDALVKSHDALERAGR